MSQGVLGQRMEKIVKANVDSMWVRLAEENSKREKQERERMLQITTLLHDFSAKDLPAALELGLKKEVALIGATIAQTLVVPVQNAVSAALTECFQVVSWLSVDSRCVIINGLRYLSPDKLERWKT